MAAMVASAARYSWHGLLAKNDGPSARLRNALYSQRLGDPITRRGARLTALVARVDIACTIALGDG